MTKQCCDGWGESYSRWWKEQEAKKHPKETPAAKPANVVPTQDKKPVVLPSPPKGNMRGPEECEGCTVRDSCKQVLKLWHQHVPRPALARAWCELIDKRAHDMVCLTARCNNDR